MDAEDPITGQGAGCPLLEDDRLAAQNERDADPSLIVGGDSSDHSGRLEQDEGSSSATTTATTGRRRRRQIPTLAWILVPTIIVFVGMLLAAIFMPPHVAKEDPNPPTRTSTASLHDAIVVPTLLGIRDHGGDGGLVDVRTNELYMKLKHATFSTAESDDSARVSSGSSPPSADTTKIPKRASNTIITLYSDKAEIGYGDALNLFWGHDGSAYADAYSANDEDVVALYCPAGETRPTNFRDAATVAQARATGAGRADDDNDDDARDGGHRLAWSIPSFPIVREESCEFRLYANEGRESRGKKEERYAHVASTGPISLTSSKVPTGIHLGLTGKASEMFIQFATGDSGEPLVEIAKKSDIHNTMNDNDEATTSMAERHLAEGGASGVSWTKIKGVSTSYAATDMCEEPATSTEPGFFVSPGHLHTVKAANLEPNTEYVYRVGVGYGQGVKWTDTYKAFISSPLPGAGSSAIDKPALTFLAFGDIGCTGDTYDRNPADDIHNPDGGVNPAQKVTALITDMMDKRTIHSIHMLGDLSYADGAAHVWDTWFDMIQPYASRVPIMTIIGNHEYDHEGGGSGGKDPSGVVTQTGFQPSWGKDAFKGEGGECGVPVSKRFTAPDNGNKMFWYSFDQSLVHTIMLSAEHNMTSGSPQFDWLEKDLEAVNRTVTPWVVVDMHRPMYNPAMKPNDWRAAMVGEGMQNEIEDLLHRYQADLVLSAHYHSYFRSCDGLYSHKCDNGGPTYITVGTGGAPLDRNDTYLMPNDYTEIYDKEHWGVGRVSVYNATSMHFEFLTVGGNGTDDVWITRNSVRGH